MPSSYVIGDHFEAFIKEQFQQGRYASASVRGSHAQTRRRVVCQAGARDGEGNCRRPSIEPMRPRHLRRR